ncbi:threonine aldolase family protein [Lysobacter korlensis]|uniref:Threonine aldolase family protein n=1 Tax=Lysobacter korlensis TaxID=553636 RepID=A0ABV6RJ21_9GAMM
MDRRQFLAAGGLAAATPVLAHAFGAAGATADGSAPQAVNFVSDGLGLDPREYAAALQQAAATLTPDYYSRGGFITELEHAFAQRLGKQAALFVPTGTLANQLAVRKLAGTDRRVLVQAESHLYNDSGDCLQTLSGLNLIPLAAGRSTIALDEVKHWVERTASGRVETRVGVISIENPVRRRDHEMVDMRELERVCDYARTHGIRLHLDGARMFNLPLHSKRTLREHAALFDTVYVSLWKHFNGASGAILAGDKTFIDGLFHERRMFGGSLPQAWPQVALVPQHLQRYEDDYARAWQAAEQWLSQLTADRRFKAERVPNGTSRFYLTVSGVAPDAFAARLAERGIVLPPPHPDTGAFGLQLNPTILRTSPAALARAFVEAATG